MELGTIQYETMELGTIQYETMELGTFKFWDIVLHPNLTRHNIQI